MKKQLISRSMEDFICNISNSTSALDPHVLHAVRVGNNLYASIKNSSSCVVCNSHHIVYCDNLIYTNYQIVCIKEQTVDLKLLVLQCVVLRYYCYVYIN